ncbi:MAG: hypothetical protein R2731_18765 [Nocardioides sp.]
MEQLVDQGLIVRRRGIGTRVVQPTVRRPLGSPACTTTSPAPARPRRRRSSTSSGSLPARRWPGGSAAPRTRRSCTSSGCAAPVATRSRR